MTYFADLTPYKYSDKIRGGRPEPNTLNIGWLEGDQPFPVGETPPIFRERLWQFRTAVVWATRGIHLCTVCQDRKLAASSPTRLNSGSAEIRVFYQGKTYAAPSLLYHYVIDHHYHPPYEFIEAVLHGDLPGSRAYLKNMQKLGSDCYFYDRATGQIRMMPKTLWGWFKEKLCMSRW